MNSYKRIFNALNGHNVDRVPILPYIGDHAGFIYNLNYRDMYTNAKSAAEAHLYSLNLYNYDICTIQVEPSWPVAEACGAEVNYPLDKNPWIIKHLIESVDDIQKLKTPDNFRETQSTRVMIDGTIILSKKANVPVAAFMTGPLTFSFQLMPYLKMIKLMINKPNSAKFLIQKVTEIIKTYLLTLKKAGANLCILCEHDYQLISPSLIKPFSLDYLEEIFEIFKNNILHICGKVKPHLEAHSEQLKNINKLKMISIGPHLDIANTQ
ncbi:MAG: hypothetical protein GF317_09575, partial [Candidatus Lokiarchaeota archaeon]|nr:hypothetical protein [Candidatus Lokiarchaeota archaeon]MBD3199959.1 hypothetical protein [Candidatus Lokiarchaeota archaeon]